jgi:hypothetical protein
MNQKALVTLLLAALCIAWQSSSAQIRVGGGLALALSNDNAKSGIGFEGKFGAPIGNILSVEGGILYFSSETKVDYLSEGDYSLFAASALIVVESRKQSIRPFAGVGIAFLKPSHELSDNVKQLFLANGMRAEEKIDSKASAVIRAGINIVASPNTIGQFSLSYYFFEPKASAKVTNLSTFESITYSDSITMSTAVLAFTLFFSPR